MPDENPGKRRVPTRFDEDENPGMDAIPSHPVRQKVEEDTELRIRPGEKTPDPGEHNPVGVSEKNWEKHNQRKDTATSLAEDDPPIE